MHHKVLLAVGKLSDDLWRAAWQSLEWRLLPCSCESSWELSVHQIWVGQWLTAARPMADLWRKEGKLHEILSLLHFEADFVQYCTSIYHSSKVTRSVRSQWDENKRKPSWQSSGWIPTIDLSLNKKSCCKIANGNVAWWHVFRISIFCLLHHTDDANILSLAASPLIILAKKKIYIICRGGRLALLLRGRSLVLLM